MLLLLFVSPYIIRPYYNICITLTKEVCSCNRSLVSFVQILHFPVCSLSPLTLRRIWSGGAWICPENLHINWNLHLSIYSYKAQIIDTFLEISNKINGKAFARYISGPLASVIYLSILFVKIKRLFIRTR